MFKETIAIFTDDDGVFKTMFEDRMRLFCGV